jgi:kynureninase
MSNELPQFARAALSATLADELDRADTLAHFRDEFALPAGIYFCGHSLGPAPKATLGVVQQEVEDWQRLAVRGHFDAHRPWANYAEQLAPALAALLGADTREVIAMNGLTVNLHLLLASFYKPQGARRCILMEAGAFSSDRHAIEGQLRWHGLDPQQCLIELAPPAGHDCLRADDVLAAIERHSSTLALVLWPGVQYRTGQAFDCRAIADAAHRAGAVVGFDHAHAIGNLALQLHEDGGDFAVWCSYKFLNSGPGAVAGAFVHERHHRDSSRVRLGGWWGHEASSRFEMRPGFRPEVGAAGWAVSNPPVLSSAPLAVSLEIFRRAGMSALRAKSQQLSTFLLRGLQQELGHALEILTPSNPSARGNTLALRLTTQAKLTLPACFAELQRRQIACDTRGDVLRLAPAPLYNRFAEVWSVVTQLRALLRQS